VWRASIALRWLLAAAIQSVADLLRFRFSASAWLLLAYNAFVVPMSLARFVWTGLYPSKYGGAYSFADPYDLSAMALIQRDCPPPETLLAFILGQSRLRNGAGINRGLIHFHAQGCESCIAACRARERTT